MLPLNINNALSINPCLSVCMSVRPSDRLVLLEDCHCLFLDTGNFAARWCRNCQKSLTENAKIFKTCKSYVVAYSLKPSHSTGLSSAPQNLAV